MTFIYSKQNPNDKDIFISCLLYRCERIKCVCKIMARNTSLVFVYQGGDPPCLSCHCLPCNERRQPRCPPTRCLRSRGTWRSGLESAPALRPWGFFSTAPPPPFLLPKWKKCANPTRSLLALNISWKKLLWLAATQFSFWFWNGEERVKKEGYLFIGGKGDYGKGKMTKPSLDSFLKSYHLQKTVLSRPSCSLTPLWH